MKTIKLPTPAERRAANAAFAKLPRIEQAKEIGRDALSRLASNQLKPAQGRWVVIATNQIEDGSGQRKVETNDLQTLLITNRVKCQDCALGGAICSLAAKEDRIQVGKSQWLGAYYVSLDDESDETTRQYRRLKSIFGASQLALIEWAFENGTGNFGLFSITSDQSKHPALNRARQVFYAKHRSAAARFKAIFTQIAKTGEFKL